MPGSAFKGRTQTQAPGQAPEKAKLSPTKQKETFAKEMHFQVYRIENVLKITDPETLKGLASKNPDLLKQPALMRFFEAYKGKRTNEFIEAAKAKSQAEREKLLEGIRRVIFNAKQARAEYNQKRSKAEKKAETAKDQEIAKMKETLQRDLTAEDMDRIEAGLATPIVLDKKKLNLQSVQTHYLSIIQGQKVLGTHIQSMQKGYGEVVKKYQDYTKQYTSYGSWKKYLGAVDYSWRKVKKVGGWLKRGWNFVRGKKTHPQKSAADKINDSIAKVKDDFKKKLERVKLVKKRIDARSKELKNGLGGQKSGIRAKLKELISREDWTKAKQLKQEQIKALLKKQKDKLGQKLTDARKKESEIDTARRGTFRLSTNLKDRYESINVGEKSLNERVKSVKARLGQLEKMYGRSDPRVVHIRTKVLVPLMQGQDRMAQIKEGTATKLNTVEEKNQKLDLLKADMYLSQTDLVTQIERTDQQITSQTKKIDVLSKNRAELKELLEGMETAYMAVGEFKESVTKNLDKMVKGNDKAVKTLGKQYDVLTKLKVREPGFLRSLYNTVGIGQFGMLGLGELAFQHTTRFIGWGVKNIYNLFSGGGRFEYSKTKKWHIGTVVNWLYEKYDKYVYQNAKKWDKKTTGVLGFISTYATMSAGALKAGLGLVNGVVTLVVDTETVVNSLDLILNDWGAFKKALKGVVHWDEWSESTAGAAGQTIGDLIIMFFTAGAGKGASAAKVATDIGENATFAAVKAFSKEVLRQSVNMAWGAIKLPFVMLGKGFKGIFRLAGKSKAFIGGLRSGEALSKLRVVAKEAIESDMGKSALKMKKMADKLLKSDVIASTELRKILKKIRDDGAHTLKAAEREFLRKGLAKELPRISGWRASNLAEKLGSTTGRYSRLSTKLEKLNAAKASKALDNTTQVILEDAAKDALSEKPKDLLGKFKVKARLRKQMESMIARKEAISDEIAALKKNAQRMRDKLKTNPAARYKQYLQDKLKASLDKQKSLETEAQSLEKNIGLMRDKYIQLSYIEGVKTSFSGLGTKVSETYTKVAESVSKLKNLKPREIAEVVGKKLLSIIAWPVWLPTMYAKFIRKITLARARAILSRNRLKFGKGVDEVSNMVALGEISKKINRSLIRGNLKEALYLYYGSRSLALDAGIPFSVMDKSFLGYLHRVAPFTVKKINDIKQLQDLSFINALPGKVDIDKGAMSSYEKKAQKAIAKFIKSKPRNIPKIPPKK